MVVSGIELLIDGLARGLLFSLFGLTITLVFGLGEVLNLLVGVFAVIAVIVASRLLAVVPGVTTAAILAVGFVTVLALLTDRSVISIVYREEGEDRILLGIFVTLGLSIATEGVLYVYVPTSVLLDPGVRSVGVGGVGVTGPTLTVIVLSVALLGAIYAFFRMTDHGTATRTVIQDETGAVLCGIDPRRMQTLVFVLSGAIAAVAGILYSFSAEVSVATSFQLTTTAIMVSIVGGVDSISGVVVAGVVLGVIVTVAGAVFGSYLSTVALFAVAIAVLVYRPDQIT